MEPAVAVTGALARRPKAATCVLDSPVNNCCGVRARERSNNLPAPRGTRERSTAAEDDRARNEHHYPRNDKDYGDDPQDQTDVTTHGTTLNHAVCVSHPPGLTWPWPP